MISLCKRRVWLVVNHAPTCPRCSTFWGKDRGVKRIWHSPPRACVRVWVTGHVTRRVYVKGWANGCATASPMGKYIYDRLGRARATPPPRTSTCNLPIFFIFFGYYRDYCYLSRAYTICNTLGLPFRHKNTPLSNPKGGSVNNYIYNRAGYSLSIQSKNGFVNVFF